MQGTDEKNIYCNAYVTYHYDTKKFIYTPSVTKIFGDCFDNRPIWEIFSDENIAAPSAGEEIRKAIHSLIEDDSMSILFHEFNMKTVDMNYRKINAVFIKNTVDKTIIITLSCISNIPVRFRDELTGLLTRKMFTDDLNSAIAVKPLEEIKDYILVYLDVIRFKMVNDIFGSKTGDKLLKYVADIIADTVKNSGIGCRIESDRFLFYTRCPSEKIDSFIQNLLERISDFELSFEVMCNAGIYNIIDKNVSAESAIDRAVIAQRSIKGSYTNRYAVYSESLRNELITEQEISGLMKTAINEEQFVVYYQPQYNHSTGMLVGAEALVRWQHPDKGLISPGLFIPIFEKNGFITKLDMYVFEKTCQFLRKNIVTKMHVVPVSINLTRYDIFSPDFIDNLEKIRTRYDIPSKYLRVEITESAALGNSEFINEAVRKLHSYGYIVEMDDFGSGYSSLNILKDIDFDVIKLDMKFLDDNGSLNNNRGTTILSSVVRMVNWLNLPIIAEGVETSEQADFLESIGCYYIQGFFYSRPLPENQFEKLLGESSVGSALTKMHISDNGFNSNYFWNDDELNSLVFNHFVGAASIFEYKDSKMEILRVNKKYLQEISMNMSEKDIMNKETYEFLDSDNVKLYIDTIERAIKSGAEEECETWFTFRSECCGEERILLRSGIQIMGRNGEDYLVFSRIKNITEQKKAISELIKNEKEFKSAFEQIDVYMWEYDIQTRDMKPCYRCRKNLGLPELVKNYPAPLFESGLFPADYSDMYYDWMKQLEEGVSSLEGIIPLTPDRIPFIIRYTTEYDETGRPLKAYGSAARVIE